ncbi:MAG: hypothetical protein CML20_18810 [Rheinheimera sp.]|uniref:hypothetical protein n=1 Tax=Arsukibacterium sp. UBA3155 TaxID=1946058 RepID=UPI000C945FF1|nr:hypothetical protein [Arsukibacterium sp. UBA3155]MAD76805.1 hypothetical protein [Rheinheimera sp.]|tara:strand:+ start:86990 stop:87367 length:378 start_codon:yes stop_codon:yes gene_type:complete
MKFFWSASNSFSALYGAAVVGLAAALMHLWAGLDSKEFGRLLSAISILAFHTLALMVIGRQPDSARLIKAVALFWHLGLWLFVWTLCAGVLKLPLYNSALAPTGGQILIIGWLMLAISAWRKDVR